MVPTKIHQQNTRMPYLIDPEILQQVGPVPAVVHAILLANDDGDGPRLTHKQVAKAAGITHIMARRSIDKLRGEGLLKSEARSRTTGSRPTATRFRPLRPLLTLSRPLLILSSRDRYLSLNPWMGDFVWSSTWLP